MKTNVAPRFMKLPSVLKEIQISRSSFIRYRKSGKFPEPIILSSRMHLWEIERVRKALRDINDNSDGGVK